MSPGLRLVRSSALQTLILGALLLEKSVKCWHAQKVASVATHPEPANAWHGGSVLIKFHSNDRNGQCFEKNNLKPRFW